MDYCRQSSYLGIVIVSVLGDLCLHCLQNNLLCTKGRRVQEHCRIVSNWQQCVFEEKLVACQWNTVKGKLGWRVKSSCGESCELFDQLEKILQLLGMQSGMAQCIWIWEIILANDLSVGKCLSTNLSVIYLLEEKGVYRYQCPEIILIRLQY